MCIHRSQMTCQYLDDMKTDLTKYIGTFLSR
jgi:hypothetical protein